MLKTLFKRFTPNNNVCTICIEPIMKKKQRIKFCCKQKYHTSCLSIWFRYKQSCPICKKVIHVNKNNKIIEK